MIMKDKVRQSCNSSLQDGFSMSKPPGHLLVNVVSKWAVIIMLPYLIKISSSNSRQFY